MATGRAKWEEDQIKSFTTWSNFTWGSYQRSKGRPLTKLIEDVTIDFRDGTKAAMLLMVLYQKRIDGLKKSEKTFDHIQNWAITLNEIKKLGIDYRGGASELANGDLKASLALLWALIRHSGSTLISAVTRLKQSPATAAATTSTAAPAAQGSSTSEAAQASSAAATSTGASADNATNPKQITMKEQLLKYLNSFLPPNLQINNFTNSFADGKLLAHILRTFAQIEVEDTDNPELLLSRCFEKVEKELNVPPMFDPSDLANNQVGEEPVMTYLISILQAMKEKSDAEARAAADAEAARAAAEAAARNDAEAAARAAAAAAARAAVEASQMQAVEQYVDTPHPYSTPQAVASSYSTGPMASGYAMHPSANTGVVGNQNYLGSLVQGSVPMELPPIFAIVAYADFNNFSKYCAEHPNELFTIAEPYHINILFTASRITPHVTAVKFMDYILQQYPTAHLVQDRKGNFPLHEALEYGCKENFEYLQVLPNAPHPHPVTLLHAAVWPDTTECVDYMLTRLAFEMGNQPIDNYIHEGRTPLMTAVSVPRQSLTMIRHLLQRGSNPSVTPNPGAPPPFVAVAACDRFDALECMLRESVFQPLPLVRMLCALMCIGSVTPFSVANFVKITQTPLNVDDVDTGRSPLELAISIARADLVDVLLQSGADVNRHTMQTWRSPIHYALRYFETDRVKYGPVITVLQKWGVNFMALDCNGYPAFEYARRLGLSV